MDPLLYMLAGAAVLLVGFLAGYGFEWLRAVRHEGTEPPASPLWLHRRETETVTKQEKPLDLTDAHEAALEDDGRLRDDR